MMSDTTFPDADEAACAVAHLADAQAALGLVAQGLRADAPEAARAVDFLASAMAHHLRALRLALHRSAA